MRSNDAIVTEVTKKLDVVQQLPKETKMPSTAEISKSGIPKPSPKRRPKGSKEGAVTSVGPVPSSSDSGSPELPTKIPRTGTKKSKEPSDSNNQESSGAADSPGPGSSSGSDEHLHHPQNTMKLMPSRGLSSPVLESPRVGDKPTIEISPPTALPTGEVEKTPGVTGTFKSEKTSESSKAGSGLAAPPPS